MAVVIAGCNRGVAIFLLFSILESNFGSLSVLSFGSHHQQDLRALRNILTDAFDLSWSKVSR